jgi:hypothetical protein
LTARNAQRPSVIQFRGFGSRNPDALTHAILSNLSPVADALERGSIVTFEPSRVRALPINTIPSTECITPMELRPDLVRQTSPSLSSRPRNSAILTTAHRTGETVPSAGEGRPK